MTWLGTIGACPTPANFGPMRGSSARARFEGTCGNTMEFWLRMEAVTVLNASFTTDGGETSVACGSAAAYRSQGKSLGKLRKLRPIDVLGVIGQTNRDESNRPVIFPHGGLS